MTGFAFAHVLKIREILQVQWDTSEQIKLNKKDKKLLE
jgi:hypothetical protein